MLMSRSETAAFPLSRSETNMKKMGKFGILSLPGIFCTKFFFFFIVTSSIANLSTESKNKLFDIAHAVVRPQILSTVLNFVKSYTVQIRVIHCIWYRSDGCCSETFLLRASTVGNFLCNCFFYVKLWLSISGWPTGHSRVTNFKWRINLHHG